MTIRKPQDLTSAANIGLFLLIGLTMVGLISFGSAELAVFLIVGWTVVGLICSAWLLARVAAHGLARVLGWDTPAQVDCSGDRLCAHCTNMTEQIAQTTERYAKKS
jgi:hypothetical protein